METRKNTTLVEEAMCYLSYAEEELNRPNEDVVTYCACHFTRKSVEVFLKAFLTDRKKNPEDSATLEELYKQCINLEPKFNAVDISCFACVSMSDKTSDEKYCLSVHHVNRCCVKANEIKDIVLGNLNLQPVNQAVNRNY